ncbi:hypothetical protein CYLTODRAFT_213542 [Cylindrobasidium torrendii FP15055 ss-10]|uniref:Uncharacterized protein n=1 Tax=Cylindrobasidium torrendii FP15055 ss-10 TaxID=1314674 RepID=A0A0D7AT49_9AGAR|nr:hypothetical protein CYLTODRAFT_213542 [Cylindrobasidium torrendii FP15055 ss-10]
MAAPGEKRRRVVEPATTRGPQAHNRGKGKASKNVNRSPWDDIARRPMPAAIRGWADVMQVMKTRLKATGREGYKDAAHIPGLKPHHRWAVGPDAAMFASISRSETQAAAFVAYCKLRHVL